MDNIVTPADAHKSRKFKQRLIAFVLLLLIILLWNSVQKVGRYEFGLRRNRFSQVVALDDGVYDPGVYWVGFWNDFVTFPKNLQTIQWSFEKTEPGVRDLGPIHLRSQDKKSFFIEISLQYRRRRDQLLDLFAKAMLPENQETLFITKLRAGFTQAMSLYAAMEIWQMRHELLAKFKKTCEEVLNATHAECFGLQLYRFHMGNKTEQALIRTQVEKQKLALEAARKRAAAVRAETKVLLADIEKNITLLEANGTAERYALTQAAKTQASQERVETEARAVAYVRSNLSSVDSQALMNASDLLQYSRYLSLGAYLPDSELFYGLSRPVSYMVMSADSSDSPAEPETDVSETSAAPESAFTSAPPDVAQTTVSPEQVGTTLSAIDAASQGNAHGEF